METNIKEELSLCVEIKRQQELIKCALNTTEEVLKILRGVVPQNDEECVRDECLFDTLKLNGKNLSALDKNLNEIIRKIVG